MCIAACALSAALALGAVGCASGAGSSTHEIISGGYVPSEITGIADGGSFDASSLTPHESGELSLEDLEGSWVFEGIASGGTSAESGESDTNGSSVVTDQSITLNDEKVECLPEDIDIRPFSPVKELHAQGFGYGAAQFAPVADEDNDNDLGIVGVAPIAGVSYSGNGFICTTNGNTLALGFLSAGSKMDERGAITDEDEQALDECALTEVDFEASLDGDRLVLNYDGVSASYVQQTNGLSSIHGLSFMTGNLLYEGNSPISLLGSHPKNLSSKGFKFDCNLDKLLPSCSVTKEFAVKTPGGATLSAKLVNPYENKVPAGEARVCWFEYEGGKDGGLTVGLPSTSEWSHSSQEFGVTPYADVYNYYKVPYETSQDSLTYKVGHYAPSIETVSAIGEAFDTGKTVLETENSCEIRFGFDDDVLSSVSAGDPVYLSAGLQDNVEEGELDELDELEPSVHREVEERRDEILDELERSFEAAGAEANVNKRTGTVTMDSNVLFAFDSYDIGDEGKKYLDEIFKAYASVVFDDKYSASVKSVVFEGHTDSEGDGSYNKRLSQNRANAVKDYCRSVLDEKQMSLFDSLARAKGFGSSDLVYDESGHEKKAASRRVAIKFYLQTE